MSLSDLTAGELIAAMEPMLAEGDAGGLEVLRQVPQLAPWEEPLKRLLQSLKRANLTSAAEPIRVFAKGEGAQRDRRAEAALRVLESALESAIHVAVARGDAEGESRARALYDRLLDQGLSFTKTSYLNQTGQTTRLLERAREPALAEQLAPLRVNDLGVEEILSLIESNNAALHEYATAPPVSATPSGERTLLHARREVIQSLRIFLGSVELFLPRTDAEDDPRQRLTGALDRAFEVARRRA